MEPITASAMATARHADLIRTAADYRRTHPRRASRPTGQVSRRAVTPGVVRRRWIGARELFGLGGGAEPAPCC